MKFPHKFLEKPVTTLTVDDIPLIMRKKTDKKKTERAGAQLKEVTKSRDITDAVRFILWGKAAGRCQFNGCNKLVWKNPVTQEDVNIAQAAHIYAFSEDGPRGNKGISDEDLNSFRNLLLTCHACHKTIDTKGKELRYSVELLQQWKADHESRIERVSGIDPDHHSHIVLFGRGIGDVQSPLRYDRAAAAMFPKHFPAADRVIELGTGASERTERDEEFWRLELADLEKRFGRLLCEPLADGDVSHLSVFALAPMPLLIRLGTLLTDIRDVEVYQLHRDPKGWKWPSEDKTIAIELQKPETLTGAPALVISLSATISDDRIHRVLGQDASIWRLTIPKPTQECVRSRADLNAFYLDVLKAMDAIKEVHGESHPLSIFPAAPVSAMVKLGLARQPKADLDWIIYDEVKELGGFVETIRIGNHSQVNP